MRYPQQDSEKHLNDRNDELVELLLLCLNVGKNSTGLFQNPTTREFIYISDPRVGALLHFMFGMNEFPLLEKLRSDIKWAFGVSLDTLFNAIQVWLQKHAPDAYRIFFN